MDGARPLDPSLRRDDGKGRPCTALTPDTAARFAEIALGHVTREYPHKLDHVLDGPEDVRRAARASSDLLRQLRLAQLRPRLVADASAAAAVPRSAGGAGGSRRWPTRCWRRTRSPASSPISTALIPGGFERPYGWAWLLALHAEAQRHADRPWAADLEPLARAFAERFQPYLPKLTYPIRVGTHFNTAFAMILALEWAEANDDAARRPHPRAGARLLRPGPRLPGLGAGRRRVPLLRADRGPVHAADP